MKIVVAVTLEQVRRSKPPCSMLPSFCMLILVSVCTDPTLPPVPGIIWMCKAGQAEELSFPPCILLCDDQ